MFRRLTILFLLIAAAVAAFGVIQYQRWNSAPLPVSAEGTLIQVPAGVPLDRLAERLAADGVIEHAWDLKLLARVRGDAGRVQAGEYELEPGMTLAGLLDQLVAGRVKLYALTIVEGMTAAQLLQQLAAHPAIVHTVKDTDPAAIAALLDLPEGHAEGWFLPETYHFPRGTTDVEFLRRAHRAMREVLAAAWENRADDLPLKNPYEALILASIVEKETAVESERTRVAGVFTRRLERGMRLETDPTVIYGLGEAFDGNLRRADLQRDTPYNTYLRAGLPPTPIAMPGKASLAAVVRPEATKALYFVSRGDGTSEFSETLTQHNRAVDRYQRGKRP